MPPEEEKVQPNQTPRGNTPQEPKPQKIRGSAPLRPVPNSPVSPSVPNQTQKQAPKIEAEQTQIRVSPAPPAAEKEKKSLLKPLRTFKSDAIEAVKTKGQSLTKLVVAEQKKKQAEKVEKKKEFQWNIVYVTASILLVILGIGVGVFVFLVSGEEETPIPQPSFIQGIIFAEQGRRVELERLNREEIEQVVTNDIINANIPLNNVKAFFFTKFVPIEREGDIVEEEHLINTREFLALLRSNIPESLRRSFGDNFMFGFHSFLGNQPFLILTTDVFENTFSGMLAWERTLFTDLAPLFNINVNDRRLLNKPLEDVCC